MQHVRQVVASLRFSRTNETQKGDINRLFRKGEAIAICKEALLNGPLTAKQMVVCIMEAKGLDPGDLMLSRAIIGRLHNSLHHQLTRGGLIASGKKRTAWLWRLPL